MSRSRPTASPASSRRALPALSIAAAIAAAAAWIGVPAEAQQPPVPDFFWPYGTVQLDGANISPAQQPAIAIVRGQACGTANTLVAAAGPDTPPDDAGKTVYVINVRADGTGPAQRPGCGRAGDAVSMYFPALARFANETLTFKQGEERANLTLGPALGVRLQVPFVSDDGPLE